MPSRDTDLQANDPSSSSSFSSTSITITYLLSNDRFVIFYATSFSSNLTIKFVSGSYTFIMLNKLFKYIELKFKKVIKYLIVCYIVYIYYFVINYRDSSLFSFFNIKLRKMTQLLQMQT